MQTPNIYTHTHIRTFAHDADGTDSRIFSSTSFSHPCQTTPCAPRHAHTIFHAHRVANHLRKRHITQTQAYREKERERGGTRVKRRRGTTTTSATNLRTNSRTMNAHTRNFSQTHIDGLCVFAPDPEHIKSTSVRQIYIHTYLRMYIFTYICERITRTRSRNGLVLVPTVSIYVCVCVYLCGEETTYTTQQNTRRRARVVRVVLGVVAVFLCDGWQRRWFSSVGQRLVGATMRTVPDRYGAGSTTGVFVCMWYCVCIPLCLCFGAYVTRIFAYFCVVKANVGVLCCQPEAAAAAFWNDNTHEVLYAHYICIPPTLHFLVCVRVFSCQRTCFARQ